MNTIERIRHRHIVYCSKKKVPSWTVEQVKSFLKLKGVDIEKETRSISIRPVDTSHTFAPDNAQLFVSKTLQTSTFERFINTI